MGKKKKILLKYKKLGIISKKWEKKFAHFLQANIDTFTAKVEETLEKVDQVLESTQVVIDSTKEVEPTEPVEVVVEEKPKTTRKRKPPLQLVEGEPPKLKQKPR